MSIKNYFVFFLLIFGLQKINAQSSITQESATNQLSAEELKGTFILEFLNVPEAKAIAITPDLLQKIEQNRDGNKITYLVVNPLCRVKIFPKSMIANKDFVKSSQNYVTVEKFENQ